MTHVSPPPSSFSLYRALLNVTVSPWVFLVGFIRLLVGRAKIGVARHSHKHTYEDKLYVA